MRINLKKDFLFNITLVFSGLLSGIIFVLHHLIIRYRLALEGKPYSFFSFAEPDPMVNLAPMIRKAIDGHIWVSDGRIFEYMHMPNLWSFLDPLLIAPINLFTGSISFTFLLGHFLSALATFFIVYFLAKRLTKSRLWSLFFSILFGAAPLLGYYLFPASVFNIKLVARTLLPLGSYPGEILMSKYVSFSILPGLPFFAGAFYLLLLALEKREFKYTVFAGVLSGLLIYIYLTDAMYLFTAMGIMSVIFCLNRQFAEVKKIIFIILIALGTSALYWWNFLRIRSLPWADEFYPRLGGELTHAFRFSQWREYILYIGFAAIIWFIGKKLQKQKQAIYLIGFVLSAIVLLNLQVIIGFNPAPSAWSIHQFYFGFALSWLVLFYWLYQFLAVKRRHAAQIFCAILVFLVFSATLRVINTQIYIASYTYPAHTIPSNISKSLEWLDKNTPQDSVVASPSLVTNALVPVFTHNYVLLPTAVTSPASQKEIIDRLYVAYAIYGVNPTYLRKALGGTLGKTDEFSQYQENALVTFLFESYYVDHSIDGYFYNRTAEIPAEVEENLLADYASYPKNQRYLLGRYRIDYLYFGPYERRIVEPDFDKSKDLEKVYDKEGVLIYKINHGDLRQ